MSRSYRKTPIFAHTKCHSEKDDKQLWHQRWRAHERTSLAVATHNDLADYLPVLEKQVSNSADMGKDGRSYWAEAQQRAMVDRIAREKSATPAETDAIKTRLMRKWMSK